MKTTVGDLVLTEMLVFCSSTFDVMIVEIVVIILRVQRIIWPSILITTVICNALGGAILLLLVLSLFMLLVLLVIVSSSWPFAYTYKAFSLRQCHQIQMPTLP